VAYNFQGNPF